MSGSCSRVRIISTIARGFGHGPIRKGGAIEKFRGHFFVGHRIGGVAFGDVGAPGKGSAVFEFDVDEGGHLVVSGLGDRTDSEFDATIIC